jgi:type VI protein secretion system component Hcp
MRSVLSAAGVFAVVGICVSATHATSLYLNIPSITGEDPTPGYPGAMAAISLNVAPGAFSIVKRVDSASPAVESAVISGTPLSTCSVLLYNNAPSGAPDATLAFQNVLGSSFQVLGTTPPTEADGFASSTPVLMYLQLPGITGESSTPGHPGVMQIDSFTLDANVFSVVKRVDQASPALQLAVVIGTPFTSASLLLYSSNVPGSQPDETLTFHNVLASSYSVSGSGGDIPSEEVAFQYLTVTPEPSTLLLFGLGCVCVSVRRARK